MEVAAFFLLLLQEEGRVPKWASPVLVPVPWQQGQQYASVFVPQYQLKPGYPRQWHRGRILISLLFAVQSCQGNIYDGISWQLLAEAFSFGDCW